MIEDIARADWQQIPGEWDATDWENSLIMKPEDEPETVALPITWDSATGHGWFINPDGVDHIVDSSHIRVEGFKYDVDERIYNYWFGYENERGYIDSSMGPFGSRKKVIATHVMWRNG